MLQKKNDTRVHGIRACIGAVQFFRGAFSGAFLGAFFGVLPRSALLVAVTVNPFELQYHRGGGVVFGSKISPGGDLTSREGGGNIFANK